MNPRGPAVSSFLSAAALLLLAPALRAADKRRIEDVIPMTEGNLRGHKMLYDEGWYIVTSSAKALGFAKAQSLDSSRAAVRKVLDDASRTTGKTVGELKKDLKDSGRTGADIESAATERSARILKGSRDLAGREFVYGEDDFKAAVDKVVLGNLSIVRRTEDDRRELEALPGGYFKHLKGDFSDVYERAAAAREKFARKIDPAWERSFAEASGEFKAEYDKSADEPNSLMALGPILRGYLEAFYHGLVAPGVKTIVRTTAAGTSYAVFLPAAAATIVTGRTVQAVGLTVFYASDAGMRVVSPTIEGGLLGAMSLLSFSAVPVTYAAGGALGAVNQVAFTAATPAAAASRAVASTGYHAGSYVGLVVYDAATGATKVVINQVESGVVLGYNALTAVPAQALLAAGDSAVFLAWDGPRLVIATARGELSAGEGHKSYSLSELPTGTVVDLKKLERSGGVKVEELSTDPAVIKGVLEKIPADARAGDAR